MDESRLVKLTLDMEQEYRDYIREWKDQGDKIVPSTLRKDASNFTQFIRMLELDEHEDSLPPGRVPASVHFLVNNEGKVLGACQIRYRLNEYLLEVGGHVGYGVRPTERGKGYATEILKHALQILKDSGVDRALITCNADNPASEKVIINNGGIEDEQFVEEDGNIVKRYWIDLYKVQ